MALATFRVDKCTGSGAGTPNDSNKHPCFLSSDIHSESPENYPIARPVLPTDPTNNSFENWLRLYCTGAPDNYCRNFKVWGPPNRPDYDQSPGNKLTIYIGTTATGATPIGGVSPTNDSSVATTRQDTNYYSAGTALAIAIKNGDAGSGYVTAVGHYTDFIVLQLRVANGANPGDIPTVPLNYKYEET